MPDSGPVAIIPARGGSKRIPRKNIRMFRGKPMLAWSIEAAIESGCFSRVVVSTDDAEIRRTAEAHGATVPFVRPSELADDHSTSSAVIAHCVRWLQSNAIEPSAVCCIYATAPLIRADDLMTGLHLLQTGHWRFVFSAARFEAPVQRGFQRLDSGGLRMLQPECYTVRSQDLPPVYFDAAQFYWGSTSSWLDGSPIFGTDSSIVEVPRWRAVDIDSEADWHRAELLASLIAGR